MEPGPTSEPSRHEPSHSASAAGRPDHAKRFLARFLDGLIAAVPYVLLALLLPGFLGDFLGAAAAAAYILLADGLELDFMNRRSVGKHVMNLRPVTLDSVPMDPEKSVLRNWPLVVGYFGVLPWIGFLFWLAGLALVAYEIYKVLTDPQGRRWGDELADTRVVEVSARTGPASQTGTAP